MTKTPQMANDVNRAKRFLALANEAANQIGPYLVPEGQRNITCQYNTLI